MDIMSHDPRARIASTAILKVRNAIQKSRDRASRFGTEFQSPDVYTLLSKSELSCLMRHTKVPEDIGDTLREATKRFKRSGGQATTQSGESALGGTSLGFNPMSAEEAARRKAREARFADAAPSRQLGVDASDAGALIRALDGPATSSSDSGPRSSGKSNALSSASERASRSKRFGLDSDEGLVQRAERAAIALLRGPGEGAGRGRIEAAGGRNARIDAPLSSGVSISHVQGTHSAIGSSGSLPAVWGDGATPSAGLLSSSSSNATGADVDAGADVVEGEAMIMQVVEQDGVIGAHQSKEGHGAMPTQEDAAGTEINDGVQAARTEGWKPGLDESESGSEAGFGPGSGSAMSEEERKLRGLALVGGGAVLPDGLLLMAGGYLAAGTGDIHRFLGSHRVKAGGIEWLNGESVVCWFADAGSASRALAALTQVVPQVPDVPRVPPQWREAVHTLIKGKTDRYARKGTRTHVWMRPATAMDSADHTVKTRGAGSFRSGPGSRGSRGSTGDAEPQLGKEARGKRVDTMVHQRQQGGLTSDERALMGLGDSRPLAGSSATGGGSGRRKRGRGFQAAESVGSAAEQASKRVATTRVESSKIGAAVSRDNPEAPPKRARTGAQ